MGSAPAGRAAGKNGLSPRRRAARGDNTLDPVEQVQEALGQRLVAAHIAAVDPAERSEHETAGVEVNHSRQVIDLAGLVGQALVGDTDPVAARVAPADGDTDGEGAEVGAGPDGRLPD